MHEKFGEKFNCQAEKLVFHGDLATLLSEENLDVIWKSYIYSVPKGVMSFAMRASTNILATADNLKR
jgi:hypothetical protein